MSLLITFEGIEGAGKSTQIRLVKEYLDQQGFSSRIVREPGGTIIGDQIRKILLDPQGTNMERRTEILLYAASRAQLVGEVIIPSLQNNQLVLCDRYVDSSIAYQGFGTDGDIDEVIRINQMATKGLVPHRTYFLDIPFELSQERIRMRGKQKDRMEQKGEQFYRRVREGYLHLANENKQRIKRISAQQPIEKVFHEIITDLLFFLDKHITTSTR